LTWRVWSIPASGHDYGFTVQLISASGETMGQQDTAFLRTPFWRTGDTITTISHIQINGGTPPTKPYHLVVAMYAYISQTQVEPVNILDIAGNPAGQLITLPLQ
jgi:hypothetical protein